MPGLNVLLIASTILVVVVGTSGTKSSSCANELCMNNGECRIRNYDKSYECLCKSGYTGSYCQKSMPKKNRALENRTLSITVKTTLYDLYVDGVKKNATNGENWTRADVIALTPLSRLIGVMAIDSSETCAGILGSVSGDYLVTDGIDWLCDYIPDPQWFRLGWDDSAWVPAYVIGPNNNVTTPEACKILTGVPAISPAANWIWTETILETPSYHQTVYCRGYTPLCEHDSPCLNGGTCNRNNVTLCSCLLGFFGEFCETFDTKNLAMTAKDELYAAYVDGIRVPLFNGDIWQQTDSYLIRSISRIIAFMGIKLQGTCPGILAFVNDTRGDYLLTNAEWKCSSSAVVGWWELGYNDDSWPPAMLIRQNDFTNTNDTNCYEEFIEISSISSNAFWIWTDTSVKQDVVVYCRGYLPICDAHPCLNGGTCNRNSIDLCTCSSNYTGVYCETEIIFENSTVSDDDAPRSQKLAAAEDIGAVQHPKPIPPTNHVSSLNHGPPPPAPRPAPIRSSNEETEGRNARKAIRKQHNGHN